MGTDVLMPLAVDEIVVSPDRRPAKPDAVKKLAESIDSIGLRHPITVRRKGEQYILVAGLHRMEAFRRLDRDYIPCLIVTMSKDDARMWEIAENLHRSELTAQERADNIAEWIELCDKKVLRQLDAKPRGGRPKGGVRAASRELGLGEAEARRSVKISSISPEAKKAAKEAGLDNNQSALLKVASAPPSQQVAAVAGISAKTIELRNKKKRRPRYSSRAVEEEPQHDRDLRMLRGVCEGACVSAQQAFFQEFETKRDLAERPEAARSITVPDGDAQPGVEDELYEAPENRRTAFWLRIHEARRMAVYSKGPIDHELIAAARAVAEAWSALAQTMAGGVSS
jgi:ParB-like chromosome segregation protein Spo0J